MEMEESFDAEGSFDDASCLSPQSPGSTSPARRQNREKEIKETKITVRCPSDERETAHQREGTREPGKTCLVQFPW
ncbi:hypothetical protein DPX16_7982 [Anabarilius grahami]|uniref:Uncharacterized protein n=1 Tax=Anabarilius grahami TaxID=495550 RepID=A0A3N0Z3G1_ANAGA|nr:hypothetical protein DPX16_7982 [Anabarilius grahami]